MDLFPDIEPYNSFYLDVSDLHTIYVEECGNPAGRPAIFLHGGPGGVLSRSYRRFFNPETWRLVLFEQRGCGRSTPRGELRENTTWDLIADIESIRARLSIDRWLVFGGSWGSVLGLAYAETHPERVTGLILRGVLTWRRSDLDWFFRDGTRRVFPEAYAAMRAHIPPEEQDDLVRAYHRRLTSESPDIRQAAALAWRRWELSAAKLVPDPDIDGQLTDVEGAEAAARISCHYAFNGGFFDPDDQLLRDIQRIADVPGVIVHGRYDLLCPVDWAWEISRAWGNASLEIVPLAGHSASEPGIQAKLLEATERFGGAR